MIYKCYRKVILYYCVVWYKGNVKTRSKLLQFQRMMIWAITKCYRTMASESLCVLAGCMPLNLVLDYELELYNEIKVCIHYFSKLNFDKRNLIYKLYDNTVEYINARDI